MTIPAHIQTAIQAYYAERATPEDIAALEDWFREDMAHIKAFAEHGMVEWHMICEHEKLDAAAVLSMMLEAEENAEPDFSLLDTPAFEPKPTKADDDALTMHAVWSAASYVLSKGIRTKAALYGSIAAVLVLGAALYLSIFGLGTTPDTTEIADNTPTKPAESAPPILRDHPGNSPVATLTATHNATWAQASSAPGSLTPGSKLHPNTRLTLTAGFAEITTSRGAVAILEAPATIELLNGNSLHLDTGRLFATVPPQATGFTVETPDARIIDIGTRFCIERLANSNKTHVQVAEGEVRAAAIDSTGQASPFVPLLAGQAALITRGTGLAMTDYEPTRFSNDPNLSHLKPVAIKGQFIWSTNAPTSLLNNELEADTPRVFLVKRGMLLEEPVAVDLDGPGTWEGGNNSSQNVEAGQRVDVYLAHFDPPGVGNAEERIEYSWSLAFDRPISGLIADTRDVAKLNRLLEQHRLDIQFTNRPGQVGPGLEYLRGMGDRMRLNEDGRSIDLDLLVTEGTDQLFILVKSGAADE